MSFIVYPAIDVRSGCVVRLHQGDYALETRYEQTPLALLKRNAELGATWAHLVDLDAARDGGYTLLPLLRALKHQTPLRIQTGGGVRRAEDVQRLLDAGADRVVVGSLAVGEPELVASWLSDFGSDHLTIALDARSDADGAWFPASHGWTRPGARTLHDLVLFYADRGLRHLLCTDIARDGTLSGPNFELYGLLRDWAPDLALQASGGVRELDDVRTAKALGCGGIVLGKALLEDRVDLVEALAC